MDTLSDFLNWAWARHQNPLSWYIRPLFIVPLCYFAYKKSVWGILGTIVAALSSMFWFPEPAIADARATAFLALERQYLGAPWGLGKTALAALIPIWFAALAWAFWRGAWVAGAIVVAVGTLLKVIWSFSVAGDSAWSIVAPVALGTGVCGVVLFLAYRHVGQHAE